MEHKYNFYKIALKKQRGTQNLKISHTEQITFKSYTAVQNQTCLVQVK